MTTVFTAPDPTPPCPTCPMHLPSAAIQSSWSTFGPCKDGRWHDSTCPVARKEMAEAKWPCGRRKYPDVTGPTE